MSTVLDKMSHLPVKQTSQILRQDRMGVAVLWHQKIDFKECSQAIIAVNYTALHIYIQDLEHHN